MRPATHGIARPLDGGTPSDLKSIAERQQDQKDALNKLLGEGAVDVSASQG